MREELDSTQYPLAYHDLERDYWDLHEDYEELEGELERMAERFYREEANLSLQFRRSVEECERLRRDYDDLCQDFGGLQEESETANAALQEEIAQWRTGFEELYVHTSRCEARITVLENAEVQVRKFDILMWWARVDNPVG